MTIIKRRNSRTSLPYSRAIDGRPSHNVSSGPGASPGTKNPGPAAGAAAALSVNCFPQCGHDTASVETCCLHSGHEIRAIRSSFHQRVLCATNTVAFATDRTLLQTQKSIVVMVIEGVNELGGWQFLF